MLLLGLIVYLVVGWALIRFKFIEDECNPGLGICVMLTALWPLALLVIGVIWISQETTLLNISKFIFGGK